MNDQPQYSLDEVTKIEALQLIDWTLNEDLGSSDPDDQLDVTTASTVPDNVKGSASFVSRQDGVVCGVAVSELVVKKINRGLNLEVVRRDGDSLASGDVIAVLSGNAQDILLAERTCLNFMGRLSGISSMTASFVQQVVGTSAKVLDTRKTTPGWRRLEKFSVKCGGGSNHRMGLYDAVLIKDNHLAMMDALTETPMREVGEAIDNARKWVSANADRLPNGSNTIIQIEVDRIDQFEKAIQHHPDIVLLDNMSNEQLASAVEIRNGKSPKVLLEASGGVNLDTIANIAKTGVDRISVGALTHSSINLDIGLDWTIG